MDPVSSSPPDAPADTSEPAAPAPEQLDLREEAVVFSRFTLLRFLGQGRCSATWLATDNRFHREIALKIFYSEQTEHAAENLRIWQTLLRQLRILNHPNICLPLEYFEEGHWRAVDNHYAQGQTLAALLQSSRDRKLPATPAMPVLLEIGRALMAAHEQAGVVHGNLNAFNIIMDRRDRPSVTDFGFFPPPIPQELASQHAEWDLKNGVLSPERRQNGQPSYADDIFAFGALSFQTLTGQQPMGFPATDADALKPVTGLTENWRRQILAALSPQGAGRPASMQILLKDLDATSAPVAIAPARAEPVAAPAEVAVHKAPKHSPKRSRHRSGGKRLLTALCALVVLPILYVVIDKHIKDTRSLQEERVKEEALEPHQKSNLQEIGKNLLSALPRPVEPEVAGRPEPGASPANAEDQISEGTGGPTPPQESLGAEIPSPDSTPLNSQAEQLFAEGQARQQAGDLQGAFNSYELATVLQGDWPKLLEAHASVLTALNRPEEAIASYSRVLAIKPDSIDAMIKRGQIYAGLQQTDLARADFEAALKLRPGSAIARQSLDALP